MPLVMSKLAKDLEAAFAEQPASPALAAQKMALAYDNYCKSGIAGGIPPLFTGAEAKALEGVLLPAIANPLGGGPPVIAAAWSAGIQGYWLTPPVAFLAPPIGGVVTAMPGAGAVIPGLTAAFLNILNTEAMIANLMAGILDIATKTVLVTFATPPPPAGPPPPATVI